MLGDIDSRGAETRPQGQSISLIGAIHFRRVRSTVMNAVTSGPRNTATYLGHIYEPQKTTYDATTSSNPTLDPVGRQNSATKQRQDVTPHSHLVDPTTPKRERTGDRTLVPMTVERLSCGR